MAQMPFQWLFRYYLGLNPKISMACSTYAAKDEGRVGCVDTFCPTPSVLRDVSRYSGFAWGW